MEQLLEWDKQLFIYLNNQGVDSWDPFWIEVSEVAIWFPLYALLLYLLYRKLSRRGFFMAVLCLVLNVISTDQGSVKLFKEQFQRLRPCHQEDIKGQMRLVKEGCGGQYGFVSSHASNTFGLAVLAGLILMPFYRYILHLLLLWAAIIGYSRIYLGVHFPGDVIGGAILGSVLGYLYYLLFLLIKPNKNA